MLTFHDCRLGTGLGWAGLGWAGQGSLLSNTTHQFHTGASFAKTLVAANSPLLTFLRLNPFLGPKSDLKGWKFCLYQSALWEHL